MDINCRVSGLIFLQCTRVPDIHLGGILLVDSNWEILGHPSDNQFSVNVKFKHIIQLSVHSFILSGARGNIW